MNPAYSLYNIFKARIEIWLVIPSYFSNLYSFRVCKSAISLYIHIDDSLVYAFWWFPLFSPIDPYPVVTPAISFEVTVLENQPAPMNVEKFNLFAEWLQTTRNANISLQIISGKLGLLT